MSKREVIGYVIREGATLKQGRYLGARIIGGDTWPWTEQRERAFRCAPDTRWRAKREVSDYGGPLRARVVTIVRKPKPADSAHPNHRTWRDRALKAEENLVVERHSNHCTQTQIVEARGILATEKHEHAQTLSQLGGTRAEASRLRERLASDPKHDPTHCSFIYEIAKVLGVDAATNDLLRVEKLRDRVKELEASSAGNAHHRITKAIAVLKGEA